MMNSEMGYLHGQCLRDTDCDTETWQECTLWNLLHKETNGRNIQLWDGEFKTLTKLTEQLQSLFWYVVTFQIPFFHVLILFYIRTKLQGLYNIIQTVNHKMIVTHGSEVMCTMVPCNCIWLELLFSSNSCYAELKLLISMPMPWVRQFTVWCHWDSQHKNCHFFFLFLSLSSQSGTTFPLYDNMDGMSLKMVQTENAESSFCNIQR